MDPGPFFSIDKQPHQLCLLPAITVLYFTANISFHSIRLILCIQQTGEIDNLTEPLGQSILVVLCAGSTLLLTPVVRPTTNQLATPSEATPFSYWSIKPWFHTEGNLLLYSSYLPLGVCKPCGNRCYGGCRRLDDCGYLIVLQELNMLANSDPLGTPRGRYDHSNKFPSV